MGVAVLQPHDCIRNNKPPHQTTISSHPPKMKPPNSKPPRTTRTHPNRQKRAQPASHPTRPTSDPKPQATKLVMGQVKILKRGEQLTKTTPDREPESVVVEKESPLTEIVGGLYAGSSLFDVSPPPSSVPLPIFITKKIAALITNSWIPWQVAN